jgi:ornithine cyclodeaminase/alanine dehydrogenase-like protein (mu-crystallin family)
LDTLTAGPPVNISRRELASLMDADAYLAAVEAAFRAHAEGRSHVPAPMHIPVEAGGFHAKGALVVLDRPYVAVKVNSNLPGNPARGLPTIQGAVLLFSGKDGRLLAILDSIEITSKRTAAASALAAKHLARRDSSTLAILGCGEQGRAQLAAISRVMPLARVAAWDIDAAKAERFARDTRQLEARATADLGDATRGADIIVTATSSKAAFLTREHVSPGTFIAAVGADNPHKSEIAPQLMAQAKVVADLVAQGEVMGDLHHAIEAGAMTAAQVHAELGEIVAGLKPGRTSATEITLFDSTGVAIQDVAAAAWAYERACCPSREDASA